MAIIRCDQTSCAYRGIECCTADRVEMRDQECVTAVPYSVLMQQKPENLRAKTAPNKNSLQP
jgi:hypothetical protein